MTSKALKVTARAAKASSTRFATSRMTREVSFWNIEAQFDTRLMGCPSRQCFGV